MYDEWPLRDQISGNLPGFWSVSGATPTEWLATRKKIITQCYSATPAAYEFTGYILGAGTSPCCGGNE